jgi:hypothetical protein
MEFTWNNMHYPWFMDVDSDDNYHVDDQLWMPTIN